MATDGCIASSRAAETLGYTGILAIGEHARASDDDRTMSDDHEPGFPPIVLTFSAADPSGGTGIQADVLTLASMGCHPLSVITALTRAGHARRRRRRKRSTPSGSPTRRVACSRTCRSTRSRSARSAASRTFAAVAEILSDYPDVPLILDPGRSRPGAARTRHRRDGARAHRAAAAADHDPRSRTASSIRRLAESDDDDEPALSGCASGA